MKNTHYTELRETLLAFASQPSVTNGTKTAKAQLRDSIDSIPDATLMLFAMMCGFFRATDRANSREVVRGKLWINRRHPDGTPVALDALRAFVAA